MIGQAYVQCSCLHTHTCARTRAHTLTVFEVKVIRGTGRPQSHGVNCVIHVAWNRGVIRHCQNHLHAQREKDKVDMNLRVITQVMWNRI